MGSSRPSACATGTHCVGEAYRLIRHGYADMALALLSAQPAALTAEALCRFALDPVTVPPITAVEEA